MKRMTDEERIALIRALRKMKPVAVEMQEAVNDAVKRVTADGTSGSHMVELVNKAVSDIAGEEVSLELPYMSGETFERLCLSNENWSFAQMDELEQELVEKGERE